MSSLTFEALRPQGMHEEFSMGKTQKLKGIVECMEATQYKIYKMKESTMIAFT